MSYDLKRNLGLKPTNRPSVGGDLRISLPLNRDARFLGKMQRFWAGCGVLGKIQFLGKAGGGHDWKLDKCVAESREHERKTEN